MFYVYYNEDVTPAYDLSEAMAKAKTLGCFVRIVGEGMEIVGNFGADSVEDGVLPNGEAYGWKKRRE